MSTDGDRPFPPSARRIGLAHRAGLSPASPLVVGAAAWIAALVTLTTIGAASAHTLTGWIAAAMTAADGVAHPGTTLGIADAFDVALATVLPLGAAMAAVAFGAHVAQTRAIWIPRRRIAGAPSRSPARGRTAVEELVRAIVVGAVALAWLWMMAPRLAVLVALDAPALLPAAGALVVNALAMIAIASVALAVVDALLRRLDHGRALRMTHAEKQADDRVGGMDPRWRQARARAGRAPRFTLLVLGGDDELVAAAIAWDPIHRPIPACTTLGRGIRATQLVALARRQGVPIHRDVALASRIARIGPLAERDWPRLAEIVAAVRRP